jgi:hypothetical protein
VDPQGNVRDWATEFYQAGTAKCLGRHLRRRAKAEQVPFEELEQDRQDILGRSIDSWRASG